MLTGYIYKISSPQCDKCYIGSTFKPIEQRLKQHKRHYKHWSNGKCNYITSFELVKYSDANITLLEEVKVKDRQELSKIEQNHIDKMKDFSINKNNAHGSKWYDENKMKAYNKEYKENTKDKTKEYNKEYYKNNKKYHTEYYLKNKCKINEKHICICGGKYTNQSIRQHEKTKKHQDYINPQSNITINGNINISINDVAFHSVNTLNALKNLEAEFQKMINKQ